MYLKISVNYWSPLPMCREVSQPTIQLRSTRGGDAGIFFHVRALIPRPNSDRVRQEFLLSRDFSRTFSSRPTLFYSFILWFPGKASWGMGKCTTRRTGILLANSGKSGIQKRMAYWARTHEFSPSLPILENPISVCRYYSFQFNWFFLGGGFLPPAEGFIPPPEE